MILHVLYFDGKIHIFNLMYFFQFFAVILVISGIVLFAQVDGFQYANIVGVLLSVGSAIGAAFYKVKKKIFNFFFVIIYFILLSFMICLSVVLSVLPGEHFRNVYKAISVPVFMPGQKKSQKWYLDQINP